MVEDLAWTSTGILITLKMVQKREYNEEERINKGDSPQ